MKMLVLIITFYMLPYSYGATLTAQQQVEIMVVDGQKQINNMFGKSDFTVQDGKHQIVVRYNKSFAKEGMVTSKPYILNLQVEGNTSISVKRFNTYRRAQAAIKEGITWIVENNSRTEKIENSETLPAEGVMPYKNVEKLIAKYNHDNGIILAAAMGGLKAEADRKINTTENNAANNTRHSKIEQLKKVYNSASKAEQKAFRIWLIEQEMQ